MIKETIKILLEDSSTEDKYEQIRSFINGILNESKFQKENSIDSNKKNEILKSLKKMIYPYNYTDNQKKQIMKLCYNVVEKFFENDSLNKIKQNIQNKTIYYDCYLIEKMKQNIEKKIDSILIKL